MPYKIDYTKFNNVTRIQNGQILGKHVHDVSEDDKVNQQQLRAKFDQFTKELVKKYNDDQGHDVLKIEGMRSAIHNGVYYNKYFWNKIVFVNYDYYGICIWLNVDSNGVRLTFGTAENDLSENLNANAINSYIDEHVNQDINDFQIEREHYLSYRNLDQNQDIEIESFEEVLAYLVPIYKDTLNIFPKIGSSTVTREDLLRAMVEFQDGERPNYNPPKKYYFSIDGQDTIYPRKYIVLRAREFRNLDNTNYTTDQAKITLNRVFGDSISHINNFEDEFQKWWFGDKSLQPDGSVYADGTKASYFRELKRLTDGVLDGKNIFFIFNSKTLNILLERLENGDLRDYNRRLQNTDPSNGLKQYIKFHQGMEDVMPEQTPISTNDIIMDLNTILYGPPGTGKTYSTTNEALTRIYSTVPNNFIQAKKKFRELQEAGQIEMVTFHQSYGYEEFVEGLKASTMDGQISYDIEDGIFKNIAQKAAINLKNFTEYQKSRNTNGQINVELLLNDFSNYASERIDTNNKVLLTGNWGNTNETYLGKVLRYQNDDFRSFVTSGSVHEQSLTKSIILRDYQDFYDGKITSYRDIKPRYKSQSSHHGNAIYYYELYTIMKEFQEQSLDKYLLEENEVALKNYVLIIDEINRGNISKIFGELITLIEPSKRIGEDDELMITLPYSGESFGVPSNLYIIGTMNTADRSIALLDTALRRRFKFTEMMPDIELVRDKVGMIDGVNIANMLERINKRIEVLYDRDHMIGHAYLLDVDNFDALKDTMKNKIIPLLQEYFYDDWEKIDMIFNGNGFIQSQEVEQGLFSEQFELDVLDEQKIYSLDESRLDDTEAYKVI